MKYNVYDCETNHTFLVETKHGRVLKFESLIKIEAKRRAGEVRKELERLIMEEEPIETREEDAREDEQLRMSMD